MKWSNDEPNVITSLLDAPERRSNRGVAILLASLLVGVLFAGWLSTAEANDQHERHADQLSAQIGQPTTVEEVIRFHASSRGVDGDRLVKLAQCESGMNPYAVGDHGGSWGLYQLSSLPTGLVHHFWYAGFSSPWDTEEVTRYVVKVAAGDYLPDGPEPAPMHPFGRVSLARWSCWR